MKRPGLLLAMVVLAMAGCNGSISRIATPASPTTVPTLTASPIGPLSAAGATTAGAERLAPIGAVARPAQPPLSARFEAALVADHCVDRDLAALPATDVSLTVLDRSYALAADYAPSDLVRASAAGFGGGSGSKLVRSVVIDDLAALRTASRDAGVQLVIESAYRSYASQATTFNSWVARLGYAGARVRSARPGHSEHQLGTTLDVTSPGWGGRFGNWATETAAGAWMADHAWEYGFVMSYPLGSEASTCFSFEPWHYRWIGRNAAAAQRASGLYPRQFLERYVGG